MKLNFYIVPLFLSILFSCCENPTIDDESNQPYPLELPSHFGRNFVLPENNPTTTKGVELGRMLFYDTQLSRDNSTSCGTCHQQSLSFTDGKALAEGIHGRVGEFSSMAIVNAMWQGKFFWDGRSGSLEDQALGPIENVLEMDMTLDEVVERLQSDPKYPPLFEKAFGSGVITEENIGKAIAQFERTLISSNSKYDQYLKGSYIPTEEELLGIQLFFTHPEPSINLRGGNCGDCHLNILTSGDFKGFRGFHNNGLDDDDNLKVGLSDVTGSEFDKGKFKAPSLRNIAVTAPYMHDGRFNTLEEVLEHYNEHVKDSKTLDALIREGSNEPIFPGDPVKLHLTEKEKKAILTFLNMLTDEDFLTNPAFSDPFINE
ncbi:cytochrome-c peroxidase [Flammeovirga yaeyamensis]|uniref:Methylamine utilization protein MauG n=1 Tax=Flammeovirga yaeyamensis TaxID=367791 RepID=A0AAX1N796_9BACT|nr:cytochrome c peroxidase [Flammeovirga yaeyamensis]MBB3697979.1 cytochrome c peroxidase [Flammeovirga yaeyamensis]NMF35669.1 cytochrome-c peroxidase [Flammeovirga yaeyamensis]QWG03376.1 cytochrome-c peroxidase [Flammeovirga yaeyamensis]